MVKERLKIYNVANDGQCLFNSIAFLIQYHHPTKIPQPKITKSSISILAAKLRKQVCDLLLSEVENTNGNNGVLLVHLAASLGDITDTEQNNLNVTDRAKEYIKIMRKAKTWGGTIELLYLTKLLKKDFKGVKVYRLDRQKSKVNKVTDMKTVGKLYEIKCGFAPNLSINNNNKNKPILEIILHNYSSGGDHYDPLIPVTRKGGK